MSSAILDYEFNTSNIGEDSSGSNLDLTTNNVSLVVDAEFGDVISFDGTSSSLVLPSASVPSSLTGNTTRTYTFWLKHDRNSYSSVSALFSNGTTTSSSSNGLLFSLRQDDIRLRFSTAGMGTITASQRWSTPQSEWGYLSVVYNGAGVFTVYNDGVLVYTLDNNFGSDTLSFQAGDFVIGSDPSSTSVPFLGFMTRFKVYDRMLSVAEIQTLFNDRPVGPPIVVTPRPVNIITTVSEVVGATQYQLTYEAPTGGEIVAFSGTTDLEYNITTGIVPDTEYTVKIYADTGAGYAFVASIVTTTLSNVAANYNISDFQEGNIISLQDLDSATLTILVPVLPDLLSHGSQLQVLSDRVTPFIVTPVNIGFVTGISTSFSPSGGAGQSVSLILSDSSTSIVTYNETTGTITVESTTYNTGDTFILDDKSFEIIDFFGLIVITIDEIPILFTIVPSAINASIVIVEIPGATYRMTYEGPDGSEVISVTDVTVLEQIIFNLVPETEYIIRLYADTGSGYTLREQLVTTTLANIAENHDKQDYADGGIFNLLSVNNSTLSSLLSVWNDVFDTGDIITVPVTSNPEFKGTFVNIGDGISVKEVPGVVIPFEPSDGNGQTVDFTLSDDVTLVPVTYDETINTVTIGGVTYSPGDSFILDGKKITVIDV